MSIGRLRQVDALFRQEDAHAPRVRGGVGGAVEDHAGWLRLLWRRHARPGAARAPSAGRVDRSPRCRYRRAMVLTGLPERVVVTGGDSGYFPLIEELCASLRAFRDAPAAGPRGDRRRPDGGGEGPPRRPLRRADPGGRLGIRHPRSPHPRPRAPEGADQPHLPRTSTCPTPS